MPSKIVKRNDVTAAVLKTRTAPWRDPVLSPEERLRVEDEQELDELSEYEEKLGKAKARREADKITLYLKSFHRLSFLDYVEDYGDTRFVSKEEGKFKVRRFYPTLEMVGFQKEFNPLAEKGSQSVRVQVHVDCR
jgi:hypothetical protein